MRTSACALLLTGMVAVFPGRAGAHGEVHEVITELTQQIAAKPSAELYLRRGQMYRVDGDLVAAGADFDAAEKLDPSVAEVDLARGDMLSEAGKPAEAKASLDRFVARQPQHPAGYLSRARALLKVGAHLAAAENFARAAALLPEPDPSLFIDRARSLQQAGQAEEAVRVLDDAIARRGPLVVLMQTALEIEEAASQTEPALARLDKLIAASPRKERWLARKGALLEKSGRAAEARACFLEAQAALATVPAARRNSAAMFELAKHIDGALARLAILPLGRTAPSAPEGRVSPAPPERCPP